MVFIVDVIGTVGLLLLLIGFYVNNFKKKKVARRTKIYNGLNFIGSIMMAYYAFAVGATVFVILEIVWALLAAYFLYQIMGEESEHASVHEMLK